MSLQYTEVASLFDDLNEVDRCEVYHIFSRKVAEMGIEVITPLEITMEDVKFIMMMFILMSMPPSYPTVDTTPATSL